MINPYTRISQILLDKNDTYKTSRKIVKFDKEKKNHNENGIKSSFEVETIMITVKHLKERKERNENDKLSVSNTNDKTQRSLKEQKKKTSGEKNLWRERKKGSGYGEGTAVSSLWTL